MTDFQSTLTNLGGFWKYKPGQKYLALLTSGLISDVFCNTTPVIARPLVLDWYADEILELLHDEKFIDLDSKFSGLTVVGPAMGAISLANQIGYSLGIKYLDKVVDYSDDSDFIVSCPEKDPDLSWKFRTSPIHKNNKILLVEDVITTSKSIRSVAEVIAFNHKVTADDFLPCIVCLVNRSGHDMVDILGVKFKIVSLMSIEAKTFKTIEEAREVYPDVLEAIKPKNNWAMLTNS